MLLFKLQYQGMYTRVKNTHECLDKYIINVIYLNSSNIKLYKTINNKITFSLSVFEEVIFTVFCSTTSSFF